MKRRPPALLGVSCLILLCTCLRPPLSKINACQVDDDCPPDFACDEGVCVASHGRGDAASDAGQQDRTGSDGGRADGAVVDLGGGSGWDGPDAGGDDDGDRDGAAADALRIDTLAPDTISADRRDPESGAPDVPGVLDSSTSPCGNLRLDPGETCDGQPHCGGDCEPIPGFVCADAYGQVICYGTFPAGRPTHVGTLTDDPAGLLDARLSCDSATVSTDEDGAFTSVCGYAVPAYTVPQEGGRELRVFLFRELRLSGALAFTGARAPVIVVFGDAVIDAVVDVGAHGTARGPGAHDGCGSSSGATGIHTGDAGGGGGGGGNALAGGAGGAMPQTDQGGAGDGAAGGIALAAGSLLRGGCPGGPGGKDSQDGGDLPPGGAGGGALQVSAAGSISVHGTVYADGAGGAGGTESNGGGGGGGGSGGTIVLEARALDTGSGTLVVTGGGGGQGSGASNGNPGAAGRSGGTAGAGANAGRAGGAGGGFGLVGQPGLNGYQDPTDIGGGGGGGGAGRVVQQVIE